MTQNRSHPAGMAESAPLPFSVSVDLSTGIMAPPLDRRIRRLSDLRGVFADRRALEAEIARDDRVVYEFYNLIVPEAAGHLQVCSSIVHPGKVGDEFFVTRGHYHRKRDTAEVYLGLKGRGLVLMQTEDGDWNCQDLTPGSVVYISPLWAHRTANTGGEPLAFFAVYPGDAGHDYGAIETGGFVRRVVERDGKVEVVPGTEAVGAPPVRADSR